MSLTLFSTVFEVGFQSREIPVAAPRLSGVAVNPAGSSQTARTEPVDIVETGQAQNGTDNSKGGFYQQTPEKFGLGSNRTRYAIDLDSNEVVIKIIDPDTQDEVRQIPTEEHRELSRRIQQYQEIAFEK